MRLPWAAWLLVLGLVWGCDEGEPRPEPASSERAGGGERTPEPAPDGRRLFGELEARVVGERPDGEARLVVVLLHGYGAAGDDLVPLAERLGSPEGTVFVLPEAPIDMGGTGRAWWRLDVDRLRSADERDLSGEVPDGMPRARRKVLQLIRGVQHDFGVGPDRLVLAGFSQGAMLALDAALHLDEPLAGVVAMSGTLVSEDEWRPRMEAKAPMPVLITHGRDDPLLPYTMAERLRDTARDAGLSVTWVAFDGGHGIPPAAVEALEAFLRDAAPTDRR